jgi:hypothetical protein
MASVDPKFPLRADHRYLKKLLSTTLEGKIEHVPAEYNMISRVFQKAGGSWERLFHGSPQDVDLLKRVIKHCFDTERLTKKQKWGA